MSDEWQQKYQKLTDFIGAHPDIVITQGKVVIPEASRADFYSLFNAVRKTFAEENCFTIIEKSSTIAEAYRKAFTEAIAAHNAETISASADFDRFVQDPKATLIRPMFNPLFNLLKGETNDEDFKETTKHAIESFAYDLQALVYEKWIVLSLVNLLKPDELYESSPKQPVNSRVEQLKKLDQHSALDIPLPKRTCELSWEFDVMPQLTLPDLIMRSSVKEQNKYVAIRSRFRMATNPAKGPSSEREWLSVGLDFTIEDDVILVYMSDNPQAISLIAETGHVCRPDLIIECREQKDWFEKEGLDKVKLHHDSLKPTKGTYVVSREPVAEQAMEVLEGINILTVGFDQSKLEPIIVSLMQ